MKNPVLFGLGVVNLAFSVFFVYLNDAAGACWFGALSGGLIVYSFRKEL